MIPLLKLHIKMVYKIILCVLLLAALSAGSQAYAEDTIHYFPEKLTISLFYDYNSSSFIQDDIEYISMWWIANKARLISNSLRRNNKIKYHYPKISYFIPVQKKTFSFLNYFFNTVYIFFIPSIEKSQYVFLVLFYGIYKSYYYFYLVFIANCSLLPAHSFC